MALQRKYIAKIHILKKERGLTDDEYKAALSSFGVDTSKELTEQQARELISKLNSYNWLTKSFQLERPDWFATEKQLIYIKNLWIEKSRKKDFDSLRNFIKAKSGKDDLTFITKSDATKLIIIIENLW